MLISLPFSSSSVHSITTLTSYLNGSRLGRDRMVVRDLQLPIQSVPITTNVVSSKPVHGEVYSKQHYVIKFVSDLRQVGGVLRFPPPIKLTTTK
jgi:hypothetical protein